MLIASALPGAASAAAGRCREPGLRARRPPARTLNLRWILILTTPPAGHLMSLRSPWEIRKPTGKSDCGTSSVALKMMPDCDPATTGDRWLGPIGPSSREAWQRARAVRQLRLAVGAAGRSSSHHSGKGRLPPAALARVGEARRERGGVGRAPAEGA